MNTVWLAAISGVAFCLAAFFAGAETAFLATDRIRLRHLAGRGDRRARLLLKYVRNPEYFLSIVLVGTNLGMIACTTTFTVVALHYFGDSGATVATAILVPTLVIFQEIIPKGIFLYYADRTSLASIYPLKFFAVVLYPVIKSFSGLTDFFTRALGVGKIDRKVTMTMEELLFHLRGSREAGLISDETMALASRAFDLIDFDAGDVMVPVGGVVMVEDGAGVEEYLSVFCRERYSRLPVYRARRTNVVGFLSIHNLLKARRLGHRRTELEKPYIVGIETPIVEMMIRMKNQGCHMAMIRDKSGDIAGMTTLEDILERLVGAIADEFH
ncbi:MAG: CNNM domain-containing protein [Candidatus Krumholzibacteriia bacterium]